MKRPRLISPSHDVTIEEGDHPDNVGIDPQDPPIEDPPVSMNVDPVVDNTPAPKPVIDPALLEEPPATMPVDDVFQATSNTPAPAVERAVSSGAVELARRWSSSFFPCLIVFCFSRPLKVKPNQGSQPEHKDPKR